MGGNSKKPPRVRRPSPGLTDEQVERLDRIFRDGLEEASVVIAARKAARKSAKK